MIEILTLYFALADLASQELNQAALYFVHSLFDYRLPPTRQVQTSLCSLHGTRDKQMLQVLCHVRIQHGLGHWRSSTATVLPRKVLIPLVIRPRVEMHESDWLQMYISRMRISYPVNFWDGQISFAQRRDCDIHASSIPPRSSEPVW